MIAVTPSGTGHLGRLLARPNRYLAWADLAGREVAAHVPNPGRMVELMAPGRPVHLVSAAGEHRRTAYDLVAVEHTCGWVCIDNRLGGRLARAALAAHALPELEPYQCVEPEVTVGDSRLDFRLSGPGVHWVELKSCTLVVDGWGRFPDAPTKRGTRHVGELAARVGLGERASVLFLIQRPDAAAIAPNDDTDPAFGQALRAAAAAGVRLVAYTSVWSPDGGLQLHDAVPVELP